MNCNILKAFKDKTVLLVDDDKLVVEVCELMLLRLGYKVFKALSGFEALKIFEDYKNQIDLVIIEMYMTEMNGQQLTDRLRKLDHHVKVLLSSSGLSDLDENEIINRGFNGILRKPYSLTSLSEKMAEILY
jgi:CheY-like chemotaxis protein